MATYNGARYLDEQLRSIVAQLGPDDEVIILDDGSSDRTVELLETYASFCPAITVLRNVRNLGVLGTFELLLTACSKDIIFLSDQDDIWLDQRRERMIAALSSPGYSAVLTNALILHESPTNRTFFAPGRSPATNSMWRNFFKNNFIGCCMAFKRDVLTLALPFPPTISMHDWWLGTCAVAIGKVAYISEPSLLYRRHDSNQSAAARRPWRVVMGDRAGNLRAIATLVQRVAMVRRGDGRRQEK
ncbi:glycosyltransferase family 2 protein [Sphingomonas sp. BK580]|uniref:glycosyltransferase family 2 protein n=1 Tax=Sphingomonas sp. BK580 TaxID=2586972 RepID=UPI00160E146A|nr:glycosyltransferase family 2 protein [Sphingomonas sp. BK580]MBB3693785.1 glycosyltransferase involved in cell wall biosynthesis [Sphingomonas sp. BK580]